MLTNEYICVIIAYKLNFRGDKMSRQSIIVKPSLFNTQDTISHYESFGWELLGINGDSLTMSRETQNPHYSELVKLQFQYEEKLKEYQTLPAPKLPQKEPPFSVGTFLLCFIALIVPCIIYAKVKYTHNKKYKAALEVYDTELANYKLKKQELVKEMQRIALEGKGIFFSREN